MFRKIPANSNIFQKTKERYQTLYDNFKAFSALETKILGKARDSKSNRAGSYANYLIRLIIFYEEKKPNEYSTFTSHQDLIKLKTEILTPHFASYNKDENRFPNASLKTFERFINFTASKKNEEQFQLDSNADQSLLDEENNPFIVKESTIEYQTPRKSKVYYNELSFYPRNLNESILAKQKSNWLCEYDNKHQTFTSKNGRKPYMESHHLIPMAYQYLFEYTIDFADNIICLCPTCHRMVHSATNDVKKEMILKFFKQRQILYPQYGIKVDIDALFNMYGI